MGPQSRISDNFEKAGAKQHVMLVTGMLGAGKTTALRALEDLGWEIIDNLPIRLLEPLLQPGTEAASTRQRSIAVGFDSRTQGFDAQLIISLATRLASHIDVTISTLFLDCTSRELERRYNETRRRHALASDTPVSAGIRAERELLSPLRDWADLLIDTTEYTTNDLQSVIRYRFASSDPGELTVTLSSFGFARGMPPIADLIFDMRFLSNPHWDINLRPLTGLDDDVGNYIKQDPAFDGGISRIKDLLLFLLPQYRTQGKAYVHVAFGCTGGRHRSVFTAEHIAAALRSAGFSPTLLHRNLGSRSANLFEGALPREK